jgi:hypothetical protein
MIGPFYPWANERITVFLSCMGMGGYWLRLGGWVAKLVARPLAMAAF